MTCIVGIAEKGKIYMGADSFSGNANKASTVSNRKILLGLTNSTEFACAPEVWCGFGFTTSWRMGQIIEKFLLIEERPKYVKSHRWPNITRWRTDRYISLMIERLRKDFADHGWSKTEDNQQTGGEFLVGICGQLYVVDRDFSHNSTLCKYDAIGSGSDLALGSLHTTAKYDIPPEERLKLALAAAAAHDPFVRRPFYTVEF